MPMTAIGLATALKAQLSTSTDPALKAAVDGYFDTLASIVVDYLHNNAEITGVTVNGSGVQNNSAPLL